MYECLLLLADPVDPADGLELLGGVEEGLGQDDVARLHQVQTVGALADRHQQHSHVLAVLRRNSLGSLGMDSGSMDARNVNLILLPQENLLMSDDQPRETQVSKIALNPHFSGDMELNFLCSKSKSLTLLYLHIWTNLFRGHLPLFSRQQLPRHRRISQENHTEIESQYMATLQHID